MTVDRLNNNESNKIHRNINPVGDKAILIRCINNCPCSRKYPGKNIPPQN
jgi:hypothetical protein